MPEESIYGGNWKTEPIVINCWSAIVNVDLESFDYRLREGLLNVLRVKDSWNQCQAARRKISPAKIMYIFHWQRREIQFTASIIRRNTDTVKIQIEQYHPLLHSKEYVRVRVDGVLDWIRQEYGATITEEPVLVSGSQRTLTLQVTDPQVIYENTVPVHVLNEWLSAFFQENQDQEWQIYRGLESRSITELDTEEPVVHPALHTKLTIAEFKVIPILFVDSWPSSDANTRIRVSVGAERIGVTELQSRLHKAFELQKQQEQSGPKDSRTEPDPNLTCLSKKEKVVYGLVMEGKARQEIADDLTISARTVDAHIQHISEKLGLTPTKSASDLHKWLKKNSHF